MKICDIDVLIEMDEDDKEFFEDCVIDAVKDILIDNPDEIDSLYAITTIKSPTLQKNISETIIKNNYIDYQNMTYNIYISDSEWDKVYTIAETEFYNKICEKVSIFLAQSLDYIDRDTFEDEWEEQKQSLNKYFNNGTCIKLYEDNEIIIYLDTPHQV